MMMNYKLIYENNDFLIIDKHKGISFNDESDQNGLFSELKQSYANIYSVHRLDKVTSGLMIIAKSKMAAQEFGKLFTEHKIQKFYLALSCKKPKKKQGLIKGDMKKSRGGSWMLLKSVENPAITQFLSYSIEPGLRLYVLRPHSGKTHQLRVAMKSLSSPILGDVLYSGDECDRTYLHAYQLKFKFMGKDYSFCSLPTQGEFFKKTEVLSKLEALGVLNLLKWPVLN